MSTLQQRLGLYDRRPRPRVKPHRAFDPGRVGDLEVAAWITYYRREWPAFLRAAVLLTRHVFGLPWHETLQAAWLMRRAIQQWSPYPDNDPDGARRTMERFYRLVSRRHREPFDPRRAAELEVEWWRVHRVHQYENPAGSEQPLIGALTALYAYVYGAVEAAVRPAAEQRTLAMGYSDQWVREGCNLASPLVEEERAALVRSYATLLAAVHRA